MTPMRDTMLPRAALSAGQKTEVWHSHLRLLFMNGFTTDSKCFRPIVQDENRIEALK